MFQSDLKGKVAIVTGGAGGIGTAIVTAFAAAEAKVVLCSRSQENVDRVAADLGSPAGDALAIATDVTMPDQVDSMVKRTMEAFGRIDILVNNAGGARVIGNPEALSPEGWQETIDLNLNGTYFCAVAVGKIMIGQESGKIVNISSVAGMKGAPTMSRYGAAKAGVINLTLSLADAWAKHNINVNCIAPGLTATPGLKRMGWIPPREKLDGTTIPSLLHPGAPERVADLALFLASPASDHISGEVVPIRGRIPGDR